MRVTYCPNPKKVEKYPYVWWPDVVMCTCVDDLLFVHTEDRMASPHHVTQVEFRSAHHLFDVARARDPSITGGRIPYDIDMGLPSGQFLIRTFVSRGIIR